MAKHSCTDSTIVIGGGIIGMSIALRLQQAGRRTTVVERREIGREASWAGAGILEPGSRVRTDALAALRRASVAAYAEFAAELRELGGVDPEYCRCGSLDLVADANQLRAAQREAAAAELQAQTQETRIIEGPELQALEPALRSGFRCALLRNGTAQVRNPRLMRALRGACDRLGVRVIENLAVNGLLQTDGRVAGVRTGAGEIKADTTVLAAGAWSSSLHPLLAEHMPVEPVRGQIALLAPARPVLKRILLCGKRYLVPRSDGLVLAGSTEERAGFDISPTAIAIGRLQRMAAELVPALADAPLATCWAGLRPASIDGRPYLGPVDGLPGLYAASGHFRSGVTLAPITASLMCELITTGQTRIDLTEFLPGLHRHTRRIKLQPPN